jgi:hypothetical protein
MHGFFGANRGNYGNEAFHSFMPNKSSPLPANALNNVQQPDYPLLFDQYTGDPIKMLAEIVWQVGIMDKSEFLLTDILPIQQVDKITVDMSWIEFQPKLMDTNPEWSQAKLVSFGRRQKRKRLTRRGIQMEMEQGFASEEFGRETFNRYIEAIVMSQRDTLAVDVLLSLQNAPLDTEELWKKDPRWKGKGTAEALAVVVWFHGIIQKVKRPFEMMDSKIRQNMAFVNGDYDTLIVPARITGFAKAAMNQYLDYYTAGASGPALSKTNPDNADNRGLYPGISGDLIIPLKPSYEQSDLTGGHSLMSSPMAVGEYYRCFSHIDFSNKHWTPDNQAIEIYDETDSTRKKITLLEIMQNSGLFDEEGSLIAIDDLKYDAGELKLSNVTGGPFGKKNPKVDDGIYDMFTQDDGKTPTHLFGHINHRFMHPKDVVEWAKNCAMHLKRENGLTAEAFKDAETAINGNLAKGLLLSEAVGVATAPWMLFIKNCFPRSAYAVAGLTRFGRDEEEEQAFEGEETEEGSDIFSKAPGSADLIRNLYAGNLPSLFQAVPADGIGSSGGDSARSALLTKIFGVQVGDISDEKAQAASHLWASQKVVGHRDTVSVESSVSQMETARKALKLSTEQKRAAAALHAKSGAVLRSVAASGSVSWRPVPNSVASEGVARDIYEKWNNDRSFAPSTLPGNPVRPEIPLSITELGRYFGAHATLKWPSTGGNVSFLTPHLRSLMVQHHRMAQLSEEHGSSAYDVFQSQLQTSGSKHLHGALSAMAIGLNKANNEGLLNPRNRRDHAFSDVDDTVIQNLLNLTTDTYVSAWDAVQTMSSGLVRLCALLFLSSEVHEETLTRWANCGLPLPFQGVIFRPNITHFVSGAIACKRGRANLGYMAIGKGNFTYGSDPGPQSLMAHYTFYSGGIIEKPFNVCLLPAITVDQYLGGKGCRWIDFEKELHFKSEPEESMYGLIIPLRAEMPFVTSITGSTFDLPETREQQLREEPYFPQALRFRKTTGTQKMLDDMSENEQTVPNPRNFICFPGQYRFRAESEFTKMHEGKGHFWNTDGPDAKAIRSGGLKQYDTDPGGDSRY